MKVNVFGKQMEFKTEVVVIAIAIVTLLGCLAGYILSRDNSDIIIENGADAENVSNAANSESKAYLQNIGSTPNNAGIVTGAAGRLAGAAESGSQSAEETVAAKEQIKVYVVGCVNKPGIVTLGKGDLIDDAVREAGGLTKDADECSINMVYALNENTMLYIKSKKELEQKQEVGYKGIGNNDAVSKSISAGNVVAGSSDRSKILGEGVAIIKDSGSSAEVIGNSNGGSGESINTGKAPYVNINTASASELDTLPGVGEATARDIIAFREKNGPFRRIEDIMKVPRIKQNRFESIKEFITVG